MADIGSVLLPDLDRPTPLDVIHAYMLILGRRPESQAIIDAQCALPDLMALGERLLRSSEFRARYGHELLTERPAPPPRVGKPGALVVLQRVELGTGGGGEACLGEGWGRAERGGRWTCGGRSVIRFAAVPVHEDYLLRLVVKPYRRPRLLVVAAAGVTVLRELVRKETTLLLRVAGELVAPDRTLTLHLPHDEPERPCDYSPSSDDRALAWWVQSASLLALGQSEPAPPAAALAPGFESLGESCDFGSFETAVGSEPPSLFRYNSVDLGALIRVIEDRLEGFPQASAVSLRLARDNGFVVEDASIGLTGHVGIKRHVDIALDEAALLQRQVARLRFLKRLFNQRVDGDGTIFVYRSFSPQPVGAVLPLWQALRQRGRNALLWVCDADDTRPAGTVELVENGLLRGYMDPALAGLDLRSPRMLAWTILCRRAFRLWPGRDDG